MKFRPLHDRVVIERRVSNRNMSRSPPNTVPFVLWAHSEANFCRNIGKAATRTA